LGKARVPFDWICGESPMRRYFEDLCEGQFETKCIRHHTCMHYHGKTIIVIVEAREHLRFMFNKRWTFGSHRNIRA
jgi:hypothetical protein